MAQSTREWVEPGTCSPYLLALGGSVLIDALLRMQIVYYYINQSYKQDIHLNLVRDILQSTYAVLLLYFLYIVIFKWWPSQRCQRPISRRLLRLIGLVASMQLITNMISVNITIYRLHIDSYHLLLESLSLYISINLVFIYWYWFWDYPLRSAFGKDENIILIPQGILFPEEQMEERFLKTDKWLPEPIDYIYFTILSSNCFGSPEGHMLIGNRLKALQVVHTLSMIFVFIIIVARAINTLS